TDYRKRLSERVSKLLALGGTAQLDPARLELEVALLAEKTDVTEELARLDCHFTQFADLCADPQPVGRRLDFLLQELGREANTIGSKCPDAETSYLVVELKAGLDRLREQVQNVEYLRSTADRFFACWGGQNDVDQRAPNADFRNRVQRLTHHSQTPRQRSGRPRVPLH